MNSNHLTISFLKYFLLIFLLLLYVPYSNAGKPFEVDYPNLVKPKVQFGTYGYKSGEFNEPSGLAISTDAQIFVSDCYNKRVQIFDKNGVFQKAFVLDSAKCPRGIAVASDGTMFIVDASAKVFHLTPKGEIINLFGTQGSHPNQLLNPTNVALFKGRLYIVDEGNNRINVFSKKGKALFQIVGKDNPAGALKVPKSVTVDPSGNVYVSDINNRIVKFGPSGSFITQWGRYGGMPGELADPSDIAFANNTVYVADLVNHRLQTYDTDGKFILTWGRHPEVMHEGWGRTHYPAYMKADPKGEFVVVCEPFEYRCQVFDTNDIKNLPKSNVLAWWQKYPKFHYGGGARIAKSETLRKLFSPKELEASGVGANSDILYITEPDIHRVVAFEVPLQENTLKPLWATGSFGSGPGQWGMLSAKGASPARGTLLVGDAANHVYQELNLLSGEYIATHFGPGSEPGLFNGPTDFTESSNGNIYFGDYHNNRIQVFDKNLKFLFEFGSLGSGPGQLFAPMAPTFGPKHKKLYVSDTANNRISVFNRKGKFLFAFGRHPKPGEWGGGTFLQPFDLAVSKEGFVYVTDPALQLVQKFDAKGKFLTQWGGWGTRPGQFYKCKGIDVGSDGRVYVIDFGNHRGQIFSPNGEFLGIFGEGVLFPKEMLDDDGKLKNVDQPAVTANEKNKKS